MGKLWLLRFADGSVRFLHEKNKYTIGRKNTDILVNNDDSISRTHAILEIEDQLIYITDNGSKYGTYIDSERLEKNVKTQIFEVQDIKLGLLQSQFKLDQITLNIVTSNLKSKDKPILQNCLEFLRAHRLPDWNRNCSFVVVSELILTAKVLCGLTLRRPIVNAKYFEDLVACVKNNTPPPEPDKYMPELHETLLNKNIKLDRNAERFNLFKGKTFVFLTTKSEQHMQELISLTGGQILSWERSQISQAALANDTPEYLLIEEPLDNIDLDSANYKSFTAAVNYLSKHNKRSIPFQEIALAVVHCSCVEYCNRNFNRKALLIPDSTQQAESENILAYDTQQRQSQNESRIQPYTQQSVDVTVTVPPSYETDMETMLSIGASSSKRPLDTNSVCSMSKRIKEEPSCSSVDFSFSKPSQSSVTKSSIFSFPRSQTTTSTVTATDRNADKQPAQLVTNPFAKKRKATKDLGGVTKKTPLENISNTTNNKSVEKRQKDFLSSTEIKSNISSALCLDEVSLVQKVTDWIKGSIVIKEIKEDEENNDKPPDPEQEAIMKRNAAFKNSILVEYIDIPLTRREVSNISEVDNSANNSLKNFKKFRKALIEVQSQIITDSEMVAYVVGETINDDFYNNDELHEDNDDDIEFQTVPKQVTLTRPKTKSNRKYLY